MFNRNKNSLIGLIIIIMVLLTGCGSKGMSQEDLDHLGDDMKEVVSEEDIEKEFMNLMGSDDKDRKVIMEFLDKNIGKVNKKDAESMVLTFEKYIFKNLNEANNKLKTSDKEEEILEMMGDEIACSQEKLRNVENGELKDLINGFVEEGYKLLRDGKEVYLVVDYDKFSKYDEFISDNFKGYLSIKSKEVNFPTLRNGELNVSLDELVTKLIEVEDYIGSQEEPYGYEGMLKKYRRELLVYLKGTSDRPIYDEENMIISKEVYDHYKLTSREKEGICSSVIGKYLDVIDKNEGVFTKEVEKQVLSSVNEALSMLEENNRKLIL